MCGRITVRNPERAVRAFLGRDVDGLPPPRFNIGPGREELVIRPSVDQPTGREASFLWWGFIPSWTKDDKPKGIVNARSETVASKPAFRSAFKRRRCIVPADGFYEWKRLGKDRQPFFFTLIDDEPFAFAAIWEEWKHGDTIKEGFCLLTTGPNELMEPVHDRMPVILDQEGASRWLRVESSEDLSPLFRPFPSERMRARAVNTFVNKVGNEGPECLDPPPPTNGGKQKSLF